MHGIVPYVRVLAVVSLLAVAGHTRCYAADTAEPPLAAVEMLLSKSAEALDRGDRDQAKDLASQAVRTLRTADRADVQMASALNTLADVLEERSELREAVLAREEAVVICEKQLGPEHRDMATHWYSMGHTYAIAGRLEDADRYLRKAVGALERAGNDGREIASAYGALAKVCRMRGRYAEGETLYQKSIRIYERIYGPDDPSVANELNNLAVIYRAQKRYAQAEPLYKRALSIRERTLGPTHREVGATLSNLGVLYHSMGRYKEAVEPLQRALAIQEKTAGPDNWVVGITLTNLALALSHLEQFERADAYLQRAAQITQQSFGAEHLHMAAVLSTWGPVHLALGDTDRAESELKRAITICEKVGGLDHPLLADALDGYASFLEATRRQDEAKPLRERAQKIRAQHATSEQSVHR